jgi:DNA invertase Pin-like site-specific DNA recombinase
METTITATGLTMPSVAPVGASEEPLIRETEWGAIRELHARGMSKKAIARQLELDIKTVRKWLKKEWRRRRRECRFSRPMDPLTPGFSRPFPP